MNQNCNGCSTFQSYDPAAVTVLITFKAVAPHLIGVYAKLKGEKENEFIGGIIGGITSNKSMACYVITMR